MNRLLQFFRRPLFRVGQGMRGRVHKISIIAGGEVSIVIRCGMDEPRARQLLQGSLVEFFETREGIPPAPADTEHVVSVELHPMGLRPPVQSFVDRRVEVPWSGDGPIVDLGNVSDTGKPAGNGDGDGR